MYIILIIEIYLKFSKYLWFFIPINHFLNKNINKM